MVSSAKVTFLIQALQSAAANNPNSFVGVVILPNRACDESYLSRKPATTLVATKSERVREQERERDIKRKRDRER